MVAKIRRSRRRHPAKARPKATVAGHGHTPDPIRSISDVEAMDEQTRLLALTGRRA